MVYMPGQISHPVLIGYAWARNTSEARQIFGLANFVTKKTLILKISISIGKTVKSYGEFQKLSSQLRTCIILIMVKLISLLTGCVTFDWFRGPPNS